MSRAEYDFGETERLTLVKPTPASASTGGAYIDTASIVASIMVAIMTLGVVVGVIAAAFFVVIPNLAGNHPSGGTSTHTLVVPAIPGK